MLDKAIKFGKEKRKPYYGAKSFDPSCRNHGSDPCYVENRTFFDRKARTRALYHMKDYYEHIYKDGKLF